MKTPQLKHLLGILCLYLISYSGFSQTCTVSFTPQLSTYNGYMSFNASAAGYSSLTTESFMWDFGDGAVSTPTYITNANHTYTASGVYTVVASYTNAAGTCTSAASQTISVIVFPVSFSYTVGTNGTVTFSNTTTGAPPGTNYSWNFGDGYSANTTSAVHTYTNNGNYPVYLSGTFANGNCNTTQMVVVNTVTNCPSFINIFSTGASGYVVYTATAANNTTLSPGTFSWNFGNGNTYTATSGNNVQVSTMYNSNGIYTVSLNYINGSNTCSSSATQTISITNGGVCSLTPSFMVQAFYNGVYYFNDYGSTGVLPTATYTWNFGDGSPNAFGQSVNHPYPTAGNYTVTLTINNNITPACVATYTAVLNVCVLTGTIASTTYTDGSASFSVTASASNSNTAYYWKFGDGTNYNATGSAGAIVSHTYTSLGVYNASLTMMNPLSCTSTPITHIVNITSIPSCTANSSFSMAPTATAQVWYVIPASPANVVAAIWNWGDNSSSNGLYTSHSYSAAGTYSICLSVTVTCGASGTTCLPYAIYKGMQDMSVIEVQVVNPEIITGIKNAMQNIVLTSVSPNPNNGSFNLQVMAPGIDKVKISIFNLVGEKLFDAQAEASNDIVSKNIQLDAPAGVYLIKIDSGPVSITKKLVLTK